VGKEKQRGSGEKMEISRGGEGIEKRLKQNWEEKRSQEMIKLKNPLTNTRESSLWGRRASLSRFSLRLRAISWPMFPFNHICCCFSVLVILLYVNYVFF
jgi:hypothetical protein